MNLELEKYKFSKYDAILNWVNFHAVLSKKPINCEAYNEVFAFKQGFSNLECLEYIYMSRKRATEQTLPFFIDVLKDISTSKSLHDKIQISFYTAESVWCKHCNNVLMPPPSKPCKCEKNENPIVEKIKISVFI